MKKWGKEGFWKHIENVNDIYRKRRDATLAALDKHLTGDFI